VLTKADKIGGADLARLVEATLDVLVGKGVAKAPQSADEALAVDHTARKTAAGLLPQIALKAS